MAEKKTTKIAIGTTKRHSRSDSQMAFLLEKYLEAHPGVDGPIDPDEMSAWALETGLYRPRPVSAHDALKRRIARHLGHRYINDPKHGDVRALHARRYEEITPTGVKQRVKYYPLFTTEADIIKESLQTRRGWAFNRVEQIERDRLSYNDNNIFGQKIDEMSFDFDTQLQDSSQPTTYPSTPPEDLDDEDDKV